MTWHRPRDKRPAPGQRVLVVSGKGVIHIAVYDGGYTLDYLPGSLLRPVWWAKLPEIPNGP